MPSVEGIAAQSVAISQSQTKNQAELLVAKKQLDAQKQTGAAIVQLLEDSVRLSKSPGTGNLINTNG